MVKYFLHCLFSMGAVCGGDSLAFSGAGWGGAFQLLEYHILGEEGGV